MARSMMLRWSWIFSATFILALPASAGQMLKLGSGSSVEILAVGPLQSTAGWSDLTLKYRTQIPLTDVPALRTEADEIWDRFVVDAERGGYENATVSANGAETGSVITTNKSFNFVFQKKDRIWRTLESKDRANAKLDAAFVTQFVDRLDWLLIHNEMNAALLYLASDWTATTTDLTKSPSNPQMIDRMTFATVTHATFAAAWHHQHHREILGISIGEAGDSARVESRENEEITINGRQLAGVEHSIDIFELRGDTMLWAKTTSVIEKRTETMNP
jgi:hypothetical protein